MKGKRLTPEKKEKILRLLAEGLPSYVVAMRADCSMDSVRGVKNKNKNNKDKQEAVNRLQEEEILKTERWSVV